MKMLPLVVTVAAGLFTVSGLHAQTTQSTRTTRATISARNSARLNAQRRTVIRAQNNVTTTAPRIDGSFVRAVRSGNPLQMINPLAPAEYGDGRDVTRHEVDDPSQRPQGLKLFAFEF